jgi:O-antigen/teichoic acid export membrane protein
MNRTNEFIKKIMYSIGANLLSLVVSLLTTLLVPKFFGVEIEQYGYLQIYLFYASYIGFFHLGLCDGIYLRDAGKKYESLDKNLYSSQFWILTTFSGIILAIISIVGFFIAKNADYRFILYMIGANVLIFLPRTMLQYYLQTTNRIKEYASITTVGRLVYGVELVLIFIFAKPDYHIIVLADVLAKTLAFIVSILWCRDIVFAKPANIVVGLRECVQNISVGIKLLFANIASMLITGIVRWGIEQKWDVATYGKISFSLSVSQFLLTFISAVALVLYPTLRRIEEENLPRIYKKIRNSLMLPLLGCMILYYPVEIVLSQWLPQYAESMRYMAILFPLCIFAAKMSLLIQTYMNVFRLEKKMLIVNVVGVAIAVITTIISVFIMENLTAAVVSIVINQVVRCLLAEYALTKQIQIDVKKNNLYEIALTVVFIISNWYIGGWIGVGVYTAVFVLYCIVERRQFVDLVSSIKSLRHAISG